MSKNMKAFTSKRYFLATAVSSLLSIFMVAVVAYGATVTINSSGVGSGTSTPGAIIGAKGDIIAEGIVTASVFNATSTTEISWFEGRIGIGTTSPSGNLNEQGGLGVEGAAIIGDNIYTSYFTATSTTATSTVRYGLQVATTSIFVDGNSGAVTIGTSTVPNADVPLTLSVDPALTVSGVGSVYNATGTVYIAGGGANGGALIIKSSDGNNCVSIMATTGAVDQDASATTVATLLSAKVVSCPR